MRPRAENFNKLFNVFFSKGHSDAVKGEVEKEQTRYVFQAPLVEYICTKNYASISKLLNFLFNNRGAPSTFVARGHFLVLVLATNKRAF